MSVYSKIPIYRPKRSAFNLTHDVQTTGNIGQLIPTDRPIECVPGDTFNLSQVATVDLMPLVHPFKGNLYYESWSFFVSNDMLFRPNDQKKFTDILTSSIDPSQSIPLPVWTNFSNTLDNVKLGSLWDYYGLPLNVGNNVSKLPVIQYPFRAYYKIYDEYFRDENLQEETFTNSINGVNASLKILNVNYKKDYFTSAFKTAQKGDPIRLSFAGNADIVLKGNTNVKLVMNGNAGTIGPLSGTSLPSNISLFNYTTNTQEVNTTIDPNNPESSANLQANIKNAVGITINDFRLLNKLQKWEERMQLTGSRSKEFLLANYGVCPSDETLERPVLIGHIKTPIIINSVVQNNPTTGSSSATKSGNGVGISSTNFGKWTCKEFGWIITLSCLRPSATYTQGIHRSLIKNNIYDFFQPIFESLGQQEIYYGELYCANNQVDKTIFGYTDRYNEMRELPSMTTGALRATDSDGLESWAVNRKFAQTPTLSEDFIQVKSSEYDYLFNFESSSPSIPQAIFNVTNIIKAIRPISKYAHPSI